MLNYTFDILTNTKSVRLIIVNYMFHWVKLRLCMIFFSEAELVDNFALLVLISTFLFFVISVF